MENRLLIHLTVQEFEQLIKTSVQEALKETVLSFENRRELMNIQEAAALLNLAVNTIYEKTSERTIPFYKHGKKIMFKKSELLAWIDSRKVKTIRDIQNEAKGQTPRRKKGIS
jgi:excisionase family DNA binding protein